MSALNMESYATLMALTQCCTENGNVGLTQPTTITYIEVKMDLEKEARVFMRRKYENMDFEAYQKDAKETAIYPSEKALEYLSLGLASEAGEVAGIVSKWLRGDKKQVNVKEMTKELGDVLWFLSCLADELGLDFAEIAVYNIKKLTDRQARGVLKGNGDNR